MDPMKYVRSLLMFLAAVAIAVGGTFITASTASATTQPGVHATPFNEGGEWWSTDGCTAVPDSGPEIGGRFDFHHACKHHDGCYRYHWSSRLTCDDWFLRDMYASCNALRSYLGCYVRASLYYRGVRIFGEIPWNSRTVEIAMNQYV